MDIFVYGDESGVFDQHNEWFVFAGLICLGINQRNACLSKYRQAYEQVRRLKPSVRSGEEIKAAGLANQYKQILLQATAPMVRYAFPIHISQVVPEIFTSKKHKQRFLDYAYREGLSAVLRQLIDEGHIKADAVGAAYIFLDEHTSATNTQYELHEELEEELRLGQFDDEYTHLDLPVFSHITNIQVTFCNSADHLLIQAADLVANHAYHRLNNHQMTELSHEVKCVRFPRSASVKTQ